MASLHTNSQGNTLSSGDGSGTHSAIMTLVQAVGYINLLLAVQNQQVEKPMASDVEVDSESSEGQALISASPEPIEIDWEGDNQPQLAGEEQRRLRPGASEMLADPIPKLPTDPSTVSVTRKEDLNVDLHIGSYFIEDRYLNLPERFSDLTAEQKGALETALAGSLPLEPISIEIRDASGKGVAFEADAEGNKGWRTLDTPALHLSSEEMQEELARQDSPGVKKIKQTVGQVFGDREPHKVEGRHYDVYASPEAVIVVERSKGFSLVKDVVQLNELGEAGIETVQTLKNEQAREAIADYRHLTVPTDFRPQKQVELTP